MLRAHFFIVTVEFIQILAAHDFIFREQAAAHGNAARRIRHPHRGAVGVTRCDFHRGVRTRGRRAADQQRQGEALTLHFARHVGHFLERRRDQPGQADDVHLLFARHIQHLLARHHHAHVDHFVVVTLQHHGDNVLADIVHIALDRSDDDLALGLGGFARLARHARFFLLNKRNQMCHRLLHHARGFHHLRQKHFPRAEQIADDIHAVH